MILKWLLGLVVLLGLIIGLLWVAGQREHAGRHEGRVAIRAPAAAIFPWLIETDRRMQWEQGLTDVTWEGGGEGVAPGARFSQTVDLDGQKTTMDVEVVTVDAPRELVLTTRADGEMAFRYDVRWTLDEADGVTTVRCVCDGAYTSQPHRLLAPLIALAADDKLAHDLETLRGLVEAASP